MKITGKKINCFIKRFNFVLTLQGEIYKFYLTTIEGKYSIFDFERKDSCILKPTNRFVKD